MKKIRNISYEIHEVISSQKALIVKMLFVKCNYRDKHLHPILTYQEIINRHADALWIKTINQSMR